MSGLLSPTIVRAFLFSAVVFAISVYLGIQAHEVTASSGGSREMIQQLAEVMSVLGSLTPLQLMLVIFLNNSVKALVVIVLGYTLGLVPLLFLLINGVIIGVLVAATAGVAGPWAAIPALAPHGIIELPALLLSTALGFGVAIAVMRRLVGGDASPGRELKMGLIIYAKIVLPALFVAAVIETFVTPIVIGAAGY